MAEKSRASSQSKNKALLDTTVAASNGTEPTNQAADLSCLDARLSPILNLDIIFIILSFLPTEDILRLQTVCRAWADIIADPAFILTHLFRPASITGFFAKVFKPLPASPKFPSMITTILSRGFTAESTSHGLVCFNRYIDGVTIVANPVTSHWARLPWWHSTSDSLVQYTHAHTLIYDPSVSFHFKVIATTSERFPPDEYTVRFQIYSSETGSWTLSSRLALEIDFDDLAVVDKICNGSKIGGGSVCWVDSIDSHDYLNGYEIAKDACWMTPLPCLRDEDDEIYFDKSEVMTRDGEIYCVTFDSKKKRVVVSRIEEDMRWVLEGEADTKELSELLPLVVSHASYDCVRKALILAIEGRVEMFMLYLSSSRVEVLYQEKFRFAVPHAYTFAPFHGGKRDDNKLLLAMKTRVYAREG